MLWGFSRFSNPVSASDSPTPQGYQKGMVFLIHFYIPNQFFRSAGCLFVNFSGSIEFSEIVLQCVNITQKVVKGENISSLEL